MVLKKILFLFCSDRKNHEMQYQPIPDGLRRIRLSEKIYFHGLMEGGGEADKN